jgi:flagellar capping protein FliD
MAEEKFQVNIRGELVDIKDTKKFLELYTKPLQDNIQKIKDDKVSINKQEIKCKQFEKSSLKLKDDIKKFIPTDINKHGVFDEKAIFPLGMQESEFWSYISITPKTECRISTSPIALKIDKIASQEMLQSISFNSNINSATEKAGTTNRNLLKPGTFTILKKNNAIESQYKFDNANDVVVGNDANKFSAGYFFVNDKKITLNATDTLNSISEKINALQIGVKSDVEQDSNNKYRIVLRSETIGADNAIKIDDPEITLKIPEQFVKLPEYNTVTVIQGDSLVRIATKINEFNKNTNLYASVLRVDNGKYALILKSEIPGVDNGFKIIDNNNSVFQDVFKDQPVQNPKDAEVIVDGIKITSTTNKLQIYDGIDITLKTPTSKEILFNIKNNLSAIFNGINSFVQSYNEFRQLYESDNKNTKVKNYLKDNMSIKNSFMRIDESLRQIESWDIGISKGKIIVEQKDGDKDVKIEYDNMIEIDADKLIDILDSDIKKLEKACILSFDSSSDKFIEPILKRQIGVNNKPLGTDKIELDFDINLDAITVKSKSSNTFPNGYVINNSDKDKKKFKSGTFFINGSAISLKNGMNLREIVAEINKASQMSRINAVIDSDSNNDSYIRFTEYSGGYGASDDIMYFEKLNLYDPDKVLQDVFSVAITTDDFNVQTLDQVTTDINQSQPLIINSISITPTQNTLQSLINAINEQTSATGVIAKGLLNLQTGKYRLVFDTERLQNINIDNTAGCITSTINVPTSVPMYQQNQEFFDTSMAITSKVTVNGAVYRKSCLFSMSGEDKKSGGSITVINNDNTNMKLENVIIWFVGDQSDKAHIEISQGIIANVLDELDNIFGYQKGNIKPISQVLSAIKDQDKEISRTLKSKEEELKVKSQKTIKELSDARSIMAISETRSKISKYLIKAKDND